MDTIIEILTGIFGDFDLDSIIAFIKEFFIMLIWGIDFLKDTF
ncbi:MAG TPA: hypothetical protein PLA62_11015 [Clostridia bacterium]|mgnify:CR=1 FL=1|nr:hypothetical protein [Clostridia bacterium]